VNAVFPLLIMLAMIYAFDSKDLKKIFIYSLVAGGLIGVYSFAWSGWWFMFLIIIVSALIYVGYQVAYDFFSKGSTFQNILNNQDIIRIGVLLGVFIVASFVSLTLFGKGHQIKSIIEYPLNIISLQEAARGTSLWPNVYTTVAELNESNVPDIIQSLGGKMFLFLALSGALFPLLVFDSKNKKIRNINLAYLFFSSMYLILLVQFAFSNRLGIVVLLGALSVPLFAGLLLSSYLGYKLEVKHSTMMVIWFMATIYGATKGVRFILLIIPAFVISFSAFFGYLSKWLSVFLGDSLQISPKIAKSILVFVSLLILIQPIRTGYATAYNYVPSINDAWVDTLTRINQESEETAIINSWWDFGHWFKYWTDRSVTFDGASQNNQQAHWIGHVLLTEDEDQAISIIRMLDCAGTKAESELYSITNDTYESVSMIYRFFNMSKSEVKKELTALTDEKKAEEILGYLFCEPPEDYFITSGDMVGKSGVWAHFGSWNFERAKIYSYFKSSNEAQFVESLENYFGYSEEYSRELYYELNSKITDRDLNDWIATWPSYGGSTGCARLSNETLQCNIPAGNGQAIPLKINLTDYEASVATTQGVFHPNAFGYMENGEYKIKRYDEGFGYGVVLLNDNRTLLFMSEELTGSMFTRLFYLDGQGLKYFKKFYDITDVSGSRIITWKIDWPEVE
ncbi:hypothetical protein JXC34_07210, partial [Candidatus Woesearchaeota archaeon]|nr:hypothetical protein [Candidatus Woesearchaeota archaeon]